MNEPQDNIIKKGLSYGRRMRRLKIGLPLLAAALVLLLIASYRTKFVDGPMSTPLLKLATEMKNMLVEGTSDADAPYWVRADYAQADEANESLVHLTRFSAQLQQTRFILDVTAPTAQLDRASNQLALDKPVAMDRSDGLQMRAGDSNVDLDASKMQSNDGVRIDGPDGQWLVAQRFSADAKAGQHHFSGRVKLHLPPKAATP
jgi:lipopolysaccharide export system protein LptC